MACFMDKRWSISEGIICCLFVLDFIYGCTHLNKKHIGYMANYANTLFVYLYVVFQGYGIHPSFLCHEFYVIY